MGYQIMRQVISHLRLYRLSHSMLNSTVLQGLLFSYLFAALIPFQQNEIKKPTISAKWSCDIDPRRSPLLISWTLT